jgi:hypothetical protein
MDANAADAEDTTHEAVPGKAGRPPPIILTAKTNLIQLKKQLQNMGKADFEFRNTRNGTRVINKAWRISKPLNPTFQITSPTSPSFQNPRSP